MPIIEVDRVFKRYGATEALRDLSFSVEAGEMFGLIGPDGAGKTTTIRAICGLLHVDAGRIRVLDRDPVADHRALTQSIGYLSQRFSLYADLSIGENIAFFAEIHGLRRYSERRTRLLEMTGLAPFRSRLAGRLSGGMKQKLALVCTLIHEPQLVVLDEPTTGVDPASRREFWKLLSEFLAQGITILMATPYLDEAERCSRVALLHAGQALAVDTPAALRATFTGTLVEVIVGRDPRAVDVLAKAEGVADVQMFGERAHVHFDRPPAGDPAGLAMAALRAAGVEAESARLVGASLEDVFIAQLGQAGQSGRKGGSGRRERLRPCRAEDKQI